MKDDLGRHLFTFAVISDTHVNEEEDRSASPYDCNKLANGRFRWVVQALNRRRPAFTVHLGDMGNPLPELPTWARRRKRTRLEDGRRRWPAVPCVGAPPVRRCRLAPKCGRTGSAGSPCAPTTR